MAVILKRRVALLLIGLLVFAQGAVALAACSTERGVTAHIAMAADGHCADCPSPAAQAQNGNLCVAHCTSDLQLAGLTMSLVRGPAQLPVLVVSHPARSEEHTSELQSQFHLVCRLLLEKKK